MLPAAPPQPTFFLFLLLFFLATSITAAAPHEAKENNSDTVSSSSSSSSYRSDRNSARLPYDIAGVAGGYLFSLLLLLLLLLTVGRSMRRKALNPVDLELKEKATLTLKTTGLTSPPLSARSWMSKFKKKDVTEGSLASPDVQSPSSFDQSVIDAHKSAAQADLERLYAAVRDHDARKSNSKISVHVVERDSNMDQQQRSPSVGNSPVSPIKAIPPPQHFTTFRPSRNEPVSRTGSVLSKRSQTSLASVDSKSARFNLKNLRIAGPGSKYPAAAGGEDDEEARTPLSLPTPPGQQSSPTGPFDQDEEQLDQIQPLPSIAPQRAAAASTSTLPLRSFAEQLRSPGIQTTVLSRRAHDHGLTTPRTGVPFTPYSPYMPFTPVTPVTPSHLVSRKERKAMLKSAGHGRAAHLDEMVQSPKEIFGDAY